jgi:hypothetical protein
MVSSVYPAVTYAGLAGHVSHVHAIDQQRIENRINGDPRVPQVNRFFAFQG